MIYELNSLSQRLKCNHCHGTQIGFFGASTDTPVPGHNNYFVGNVINNIHHYAKHPNDPMNPYEGSGTALVNWGGYNRNVVNNTIYDVDAGINSPDSGSWLL